MIPSISRHGRWRGSRNYGHHRKGNKVLVFQYERFFYDDIVERVEAFECYDGDACGVEAVHECIDGGGGSHARPRR